MREDEFPERRPRGEVEGVWEEASEAAEVLHLHCDVHLLLSETDRLLHHTLVLQLRQRAGGVEQLSTWTSRLEPRPESKDEDTSVPNQTPLILHTYSWTDTNIVTTYSLDDVLQIIKLIN